MFDWFACLFVGCVTWESAMQSLEASTQAVRFFPFTFSSLDIQPSRIFTFAHPILFSSFFSFSIRDTCETFSPENFILQTFFILLTPCGLWE